MEMIFVGFGTVVLFGGLILLLCIFVGAARVLAEAVACWYERRKYERLRREARANLHRLFRADRRS